MTDTFVRVLRHSTSSLDASKAYTGQIGKVTSEVVGGAYVERDGKMEYLQEQKVWHVNGLIGADGRPIHSTPVTEAVVVAELDKADPMVLLYQSGQKTLEAYQSRSMLADKYEKAIAVISDALIEECEERGWCDEYDAFVEKVNGMLPGEPLLRLREREVEVEVSRRRIVTESTTVTLRVPANATDREIRDLAIEEAENDWGNLYWNEDDEETDEYETGDID